MATNQAGVIKFVNQSTNIYTCRKMEKSSILPPAGGPTKLLAAHTLPAGFVGPASINLVARAGCWTSEPARLADRSLSGYEASRRRGLVGYKGL